LINNCTHLILSRGEGLNPKLQAYPIREKSFFLRKTMFYAQMN
jgi:hypothetical protein